MSNLQQIMNGSPVFQSLEQTDMDRLAPLFRSRELQTGDILTTEGEAAQYFFLLEEGTLLLGMEDGKGLVLDSPGDFAGMEMLSVKGVYRTTTTVLAPGRAHAVLRQDFLEFIQADTQGAAAVMAAWQTVLDQRAPFAKEIETQDFPQHI